MNSFAKGLVRWFLRVFLTSGFGSVLPESLLDAFLVLVDYAFLSKD